MSETINYHGYGTILQGPNASPRFGAQDANPWILSVELTINNGSISSSITKEVPKISDTEREELREVKTTTHLPRLQADVRYKYTKLCSHLDSIGFKWNKNSWILKQIPSSTLSYRIKDLETAISSLNQTPGITRACLHFKLLKIDSKMESLGLSSTEKIKTVKENNEPPQPSIHALIASAMNSSADPNYPTRSTLLNAFPDVAELEIKKQELAEETDDILI